MKIKILKLLMAMLGSFFGLALTASPQASAQVSTRYSYEVYDINYTKLRPGTYSISEGVDGSVLQFTFDYNRNQELEVVRKSLLKADGTSVPLDQYADPRSTQLTCGSNETKVCTKSGSPPVTSCTCVGNGSGGASDRLSGGAGNDTY